MKDRTVLLMTAWGSQSHEVGDREDREGTVCSEEYSMSLKAVCEGLGKGHIHVVLQIPVLGGHLGDSMRLRR